MTANEFLDMWCEKRKMSRAEALEDFVVLPCSCGDLHCKAWAMVPNDEVAIKDHIETGGKEE